MNLLATLRLRWQSRAPVVLGTLALGLINVALQPCVLAAGVEEPVPVRTADVGYHADPVWQAASESQKPCLFCEVHKATHCDGRQSEDCATVDQASANNPIKPTDRSSDLTIIPPPSLAATISFSRLQAFHEPARAMLLPRGPSLNIRYCVFLK